MYIIIIALIILFLFCNIEIKENYTNYQNAESYYIDDFDIETTPYSHKSEYNFSYLDKCDVNAPGSCLNSRCVYKSMTECQDKCKTGCRHCGAFGLYMCDLQ
jgi:hypothetical protein